MKEQPKNIDEQLRNLEQQQIPDLSQMDNHWKDFSGKAAPVLQFRRYFYWISAFVIILITIILLVGRFGSQPTHQTELAQQSRPNESTNPSISDKNPTDTVPGKSLPIKSSGRLDKVYSTDSFPAPRKLPKKKKAIVVKKSNNIDSIYLQNEIKEDNSDNSRIPETLERFFAQLATPAQRFAIDNRFDTILVGKQGSLLAIPANCFGKNKTVTIVLTEYYTQQEFVCNRLVTVADQQLLESGGMVRIEAFENGQPIGLLPQQKIRWYVADKKQDFGSMQLFQGKPFASRTGKDSTSYALINWVPRQIPITKIDTYRVQKVLDIRNTPYKTKYRKGGEVGYFVMDPNAVITSTELAAQLKEKFKYQKVIIRPAPKRTDSYFGQLFKNSARWNVEQLGDSTVMDTAQANFYRLELVTTVRKAESFVGIKVDSTVWEARMNMIELSRLTVDRYGVDLGQLGWINCDRFYKERGPKKSLEIEIDDNTSHYYTTLVFKKRKMALPGIPQGNKVLFPEIPVGEKILIICVGIKDGKTRSAMVELVSGESKVTIRDFEEIDPVAFKQKFTYNFNK